MSPTQVNGFNSTSATSELAAISDTANLEADINQLNALLSQDSLSSDDNANVVELLQRLENANSVAQGVESKLDDMIGKLDSLITSLETKDDSVDVLARQPQSTDHTEESSTSSA